MSQLHTKFTDQQVKELFDRYLKKEIERKYLQQILGLSKTQFFYWLQTYRAKPEKFTIQYQRKTAPRSLDPKIEKNILKELTVSKQLILDPKVPVRRYNYSYVKDLLKSDYRQDVALSTIIDRAKTYGFHLGKRKKSRHDREVLTRYTGELIQHDSSFHLWAPASNERWYLITSLDDHSRLILYAQLVKQETTWVHIEAAQTVFLQYGLPFSYYVDSHAIFRFVRERDALHRTHSNVTDDVDPQWKKVLEDCQVKVIYALSAQAKGKIERPYQWLQDRLVRTFVRHNVTDIRQARTFLSQEIQRYNFRQVHSTTLEVPYYRFQKALKEKRSLFRPFQLPLSCKSVKDLFCLRFDRNVDAYRRVSILTLEVQVNHATPGDILNIRIYPLKHGVCELRFWNEDQLLDVQRAKVSDLQGVHF